MPENQKRILEMLSEKKISVEEAERLLALTGSEESREQASDKSAEKKSGARYLRVVVEPNAEDGSPSHRRPVNIRVPMKLLRAGMKFSALIPPHAADKVHEALREKGVNFDLRNLKVDDVDELIEALSDLEVKVDGDKEKVRIYVE